jgi:hypothetical protein
MVSQLSQTEIGNRINKKDIPMNIGKILKVIGVLAIICGFISAIPVFGSYKIIAFYYIASGLISGFILIGFGELITLAKSIDERLQTKFYEPQKKNCPHCNELIRKDALICRFCQKDL